jgi:phosphate-selective porin OprO/OprP
VSNHFAKRGFALLAAISVLPAAAGAADPSADALDQRLKVIERQLEIQKEEADAKAKDAAVVKAGEKGFAITSADEKWQLNFRALIQADARFFVGDPAGQGFNDTFLLRRVEPSFSGSLGKLVGFQITPQFTAGSNSTPGASITDIYVDLKFDPAATVRVGRFKGPISGLENVRPTGATKFVERGLPTYLLPARDYGVQLHGTVFGGALTYSGGIYNGARDGSDATATDADNRHELAARVFAEPFKNSPGFFQGLGFGVAAGKGRKLGSNVAGGNQVLPSYVTTGQNSFFSYSPPAAGTPPVVPTVAATGDQTRINPQLFFFRNGFGFLAEYVTSKQALTSSGVTTSLTHKAYNVETTYLVTGEDASYSQPVKPKHPYAVGGEGWGALEVGARHGAIDIDDDAFPTFSDPAKSASKAQEYGAVLAWYPTSNLKVATDYNFTKFDGGAAGGGNRPIERAIFARVQVWY